MQLFEPSMDCFGATRRPVKANGAKKGAQRRARFPLDSHGGHDVAGHGNDDGGGVGGTRERQSRVSVFTERGLDAGGGELPQAPIRDTDSGVSALALVTIGDATSVVASSDTPYNV